VVIGNPPYIRADNPVIKELRQQIMKSKQYVTLYEKWDLMVAFYEKSLRMLSNEGINAFIASNSITTSKFAYKLQDWILENFRVKSIDHFEDNMQIFKAGVVPVVTIIQKTKQDYKVKKIYRVNVFDNIDKIQEVDTTQLLNLRERVFKKSFSDIFYPNIQSELLGDICYLSVGMVINADENSALGEFTKNDLISEIKDEIHFKKYIEGKYLKRYNIKKIKYLEWNTYRVPSKLRRPTFPSLYKGDKIFRGRVTEGTFDDTGIVCNDSIVVFKRFVDLNNIKERSISVSISKNNFDGKGSKTSAQVNKRRMELENVSSNFSLKYLLAIINSKYALAYLNNFRKHRLKNYFYPDDFRNYPIPKIYLQEQELFVTLVDYILYLKQQPKDEMSFYFEQIIDGMAYELYFGEEIKQAGCDILKYLNDLPTITVEMSEPEKFKIIPKVFNKL